MPDRDERGHFLPGHSIPGPGPDPIYTPEMNDAARKLALLGMTDAEIAAFFGVHERTINTWKKEYPAFAEQLASGKTIADANVADSLYRRAMGEVTYVEKRVKNADGKYEIIRLSQSVPADPGAAKLWLTNRQPRLWRDKQAVELTGADGGPVQTEDVTKRDADEFARRMAVLASRAGAAGGTGEPDA